MPHPGLMPLNGGLIRGLMPHPGLLHPEPLPLRQATAILPQETLCFSKHSSGSASVGSLGPGLNKVCLSPPSVYGGYEV